MLEMVNDYQKRYFSSDKAVREIPNNPDWSTCNCCGVQKPKPAHTFNVRGEYIATFCSTKCMKDYLGVLYGDARRTVKE